MKTGLFIIDMQNDFCCPWGSMYVTGADKDAMRLARLIAACGKDIDGIILTCDNHQVMDIAHPAFWKDRKGMFPEPYTVVTKAEVEAGIWQPFRYKKQVLCYLGRLEAEQGEFHRIWPEHCIAGSEGAAIVPCVMREIKAWAKRGHYFQIIEKGTYPLAEHYGAFRTEVIDEVIPETWFNIPLLRLLDTYDTLWIAGEAKTHCVAETLKQLMKFPALMQKIVIVEDCMSDIAGQEERSEFAFGQAGKMGARFMTSEKLRQSIKVEKEK